MSKLQKSISLTLTTLLTVGLLLGSAIGAMAAGTPFTLTGTLVFDGTGYSVDTQAIVLDPGVVCKDDTGVVLLTCATLATKLVEAIGTSELGVWTVTEINGLGTYQGLFVSYVDDIFIVDAKEFIVNSDTVLPPFYAVNDTVKVTYKPVVSGMLALKVELIAVDPNNTYYYEGNLNSMVDPKWDIGAYSFVVNSDTVLPPFILANDYVGVTFKMVGADYVAQEITLITSNSDNTYEYEGELMDFSDTEWMVGDYTFNIEGVSLPIYFGVGDIYKIFFKITADGYVATGIELVETYIPPKVESARCEGLMEGETRLPNGIAKKLPESSDEAQIQAMFCKGYGWGEIKNAFKWGDTSAYTPEMLLAMRGKGHSWGELKKMASANPDGTAAVSPANHPNNGNGNGNSINNQDNSDQPGNSENAPGQNKDKDKDKDNPGKAKGKNK